MNFCKLEKLQDELTNVTVAGNDISVFVDGKEVYRRQAGYADIESGRKMQGNELFFLWSGTKLFTCSLALRLIEDGKLKIDAPLSDYLPEFSDMIVQNGEGIVSAKAKIKIRNLFTMTAGFDYNFCRPSIEETRKATGGRCPTREVMRAIAKTPLVYQPGEHFLYSMGHDVLGGVIEAVSGKRLCDYARETLFEPLGMNDTFFGIPTAAEQDRMATQYLWRRDLKKAVPMKKTCGFILGEAYDSGGAGAVTTCSDYMKFAKTIANGGVAENGYRYIKRETIDMWSQDELNAVQYADFRRDWGDGYSYGLGVKTIIDHAEYGARDNYIDFGWGGAAGMRVHICPNENIALVFMTHIHEYEGKKLFEKKLRNTVFECIMK